MTPSGFLLVCAGGAVGTGARYLVTAWLTRLIGVPFPWGTLAVNVVGSLLIGLVMHAGASAEVISPIARNTLAIGVLGGFTTFSSFSYDTVAAFESGAWPGAAVNVAANTLGCLTACWGGLALGRSLFPAG